MFKVVEMFIGIQSEGKHAGTPATFIRLFGCNLNCQFTDKLKCDEPLHKNAACGIAYTMEQLTELCDKWDIPHIVITGGEPSLQDLNPLFIRLKEMGFYVQVETNGENLGNIKEATWITYSPKFMFDGKAKMHQLGFSELKLLASPQNVPDKDYWKYVRVPKYIQPIGLENEWDMENVKWCADWVMKNSGWKLSLQTHKIYGGQ